MRERYRDTEIKREGDKGIQRERQRESEGEGEMERERERERERGGRD